MSQSDFDSENERSIFTFIFPRCIKMNHYHIIICYVPQNNIPKNINKNFK